MFRVSSLLGLGSSGGGDAPSNAVEVALALSCDAAPTGRALLHNPDGLKLLQHAASEKYDRENVSNMLGTMYLSP